MFLGILAVAGNLAVWWLIIRLQNRDAASGLIPSRGAWSQLGTGRIPHLQDYWTNGVWGDAIALSAVDWAALSALSSEGLSWWQLVSVFFGVAVATMFFKLATREERARKGMDWWFVPYFQGFAFTGVVKVTLAGRLHLAYFAVQSGLGLLLVLFLLSGKLEVPEVVAGAAGGLVYGLAFASDKVQGHI